jgi:hypothetical protein
MQAEKYFVILKFLLMCTKIEINFHLLGLHACGALPQLSFFTPHLAI